MPTIKDSVRCCDARSARRFGVVRDADECGQCGRADQTALTTAQNNATAAATAAVTADAAAAAAALAEQTALNAAANKTPVSPSTQAALDALLVGK